jgi:hypothetical protein
MLHHPSIWHVATHQRRNSQNAFHWRTN